ncbi:hypothetical protein E2C01_071341 [Portunus trituberculatus]|uniref:Uncharacterized protein n=1 Tax=Portunus trituberculatus TaxID=210409 RepID=A0A5B7I4Q8_PORTR|nr:hypothetical protein [Portunus trituberculatus]
MNEAKLSRLPDSCEKCRVIVTSNLGKQQAATTHRLRQPQDTFSGPLLATLWLKFLHGNHGFTGTATSESKVTHLEKRKSKGVERKNKIRDNDDNDDDDDDDDDNDDGDDDDDECLA